MADDMKPSEWEWKQENNQFIPIMTEKIAAPDELLKIIHCNCSGDANPLDAAADATDSPALLHVALAKLKTVTIQTTLNRRILRRRMTLKTERSETYSMNKGVCAVDDSGQLKVINSIS